MISVMVEQRPGVQIGRRIQQERQRVGWSQQQLAIQAGVDRSWIASLEAGNTDDPSAARVVRVAQAMGSDLGWVLTGVRGDAEEPSDSILRRLKALYSTEQLDRLYGAAAALFLDLGHVARHPADQGGHEERQENPADAGADDNGVAGA